jgi:PadR family transcriptional regulator, regulatory protein PadR
MGDDDPRLTMQTGAVLKALLVKPSTPRYGLEISKEAGLPRGTIYPILTRLEQAGWLDSFWEDIDEAAEGRRKRRYYRLSEKGAVKGRQALEAASQRLSLGWLPALGPGGARA